MTIHNTLRQLILVPTRIEKVGDMIQRSIIDHCYASKEESIKEITVEELGDSDHLCVKFIKQKKKIFSLKLQRKSTTIKRLIY